MAVKIEVPTGTSVARLRTVLAAVAAIDANSNAVVRAGNGRLVIEVPAVRATDEAPALAAPEPAEVVAPPVEPDPALEVPLAPPAAVPGAVLPPVMRKGTMGAQVVEELRERGPVEDPRGFASLVLAERIGAAANGNFQKTIKRLADAGVVRREMPNPRRCSRIELVEGATWPIRKPRQRPERERPPLPPRPAPAVEAPPPPPPPPMDPPVVLEVLEEAEGLPEPTAAERREQARLAAVEGM